MRIPMSIATLLLISASVGCPQATPAVGPLLACGGDIVDDALNGETFAQIVADPAVQAACANAGETVVEVVISVLTSSSDPKVQASAAGAEATRLKAARGR